MKEILGVISAVVENKMKAILVIDEMPNSCGECPLKYLEERWMCNLTDKIVSIDCEKPKPKWCPLRPMSEKKTIFHEYEFEDLMNLGWNACIDEILGETE